MPPSIPGPVQPGDLDRVCWLCGVPLGAVTMFRIGGGALPREMARAPDKMRRLRRRYVEAVYRAAGAAVATHVDIEQLGSEPG